MNTFAKLTVTFLFLFVVASPALAQQPGSARDPHHPAPGAETSPPAAAPGVKPETMPMMEMCHRMMEGMGGMRGMPMMSGGPAMDPKERAEMLEMRGEMMKAMGDIMLKHAHRMQGTPK